MGGFYVTIRVLRMGRMYNRAIHRTVNAWLLHHHGSVILVVALTLVHTFRLVHALRFVHPLKGDRQISVLLRPTTLFNGISKQIAREQSSDYTHPHNHVPNKERR